MQHGPLPSPMRQLLALSTLMTLARALTTPVLVLSLAQQLRLGLPAIGMLLGAVLVVATLCGLYGGHLVDRWRPRRLLIGAAALIAAGLALLPAARAPAPALVALLLSETAFGVFGIAVKAALSDGLPAAARARGFSLRYTLTNLAFAVGPFIGSALAGRHAAAPFWAAAMLAASLLPWLAWLRLRDIAADGAPAGAPGFVQTLALLGGDRALVLFTLGCLLGCVVHGRFSDYLALVLLGQRPAAEVMQWMSALIACNALAVVLLQLPIGQRIQRRHAGRWIALGSLLLAAGLAGFWHAASLAGWCLAMLVFTLGEIIIVPAEMLVVDAIAPAAYKGSYFAAHHLAQLGSAASPALCALVLAHGAPGGLFGLLIALALLGALLVAASGAARVTFRAARASDRAARAVPAGSWSPRGGCRRGR
ncbi:MFS transporter [Aquincola sp. S2]|uniref:MFS transporter n=1 Tax=Pseudaquabacterium terrae TaxID=2732868 RepID=A0ABX2EHW3_9BURK|nr:MFS transporter [Aquabacterium terrae]NRF68223.1 MFS transporter [Aquabacterium terrae]